MHVTSESVSLVVACVMAAASLIAGIYAILKLKELKDMERLPLIAIAGGCCLSLMMISIKADAGLSISLCGAMLLAALIGPYAGFLTMSVLIVVQSVLSGAGSMALGCNIWNIAFYGCFMGTFAFYRPILKAGVTKPKLIVASFVSCVLINILSALSGILEVYASDTSIKVMSLLSSLCPLHIGLGIAEGLIMAIVLTIIFENRPILLYGFYARKSKSKMPYKKIMMIITVISLALAVVAVVITMFKPAMLAFSSMTLYGIIAGIVLILAGFIWSGKYWEKA